MHDKFLCTSLPSIGDFILEGIETPTKINLIILITYIGVSFIDFQDEICYLYFKFAEADMGENDFMSVKWRMT